MCYLFKPLGKFCLRSGAGMRIEPLTLGGKRPLAAFIKSVRANAQDFCSSNKPQAILISATFILVAVAFAFAWASDIYVLYMGGAAPLSPFASNWHPEWLLVAHVVPMLPRRVVSPPTSPTASGGQRRGLGSDEFAAAIAHEIGQPLSAVIAQLGAARNWLSRDPPSLSEVQSALQAADASSQRCMEILRSLRRLSRSASMKSKKVDLNETIRRSLEPLCIREKIGERNLRLELDQDLPLISGRPVELELLFVNLLRNAIEAMEGRSGPQLLKIQTFRIGRKHIGALVKDSGPGIPAQDADAVFDAFFTKKKDGLGIGLSLCRRIVEAHSGTLHAQNGRIRGASFEVRLPVGGGHE